MLRQDHDADARMPGADGVGSVDALHAVGWRHADVDQRRVRGPRELRRVGGLPGARLSRSPRYPSPCPARFRPAGRRTRGGRPHHRCPRDLLAGLFERSRGRRRLTPAAYRHGPALALPERLDWRARQDSNLRPSAPEADALSTELQARTPMIGAPADGGRGGRARRGRQNGSGPARGAASGAVPVKVRRLCDGAFCHAPRASITSAEPTTLTQPTHDLGAGAAWLTCSERYGSAPIRVCQGFRRAD